MPDVTSLPPVELLLQLFGDTPTKMFINGVIMAIIAYLAWRWLLEPAHTVAAAMLSFWKLRKRPAAFLEITPPHQSEKSPVATQRLFSILQQRIGRHGTMSLEIISSRKEGIRYLIRTRPGDAEILQRHVASYLPEAKFEVLDEPPQPVAGNYYSVYEVKQAWHYAYPLHPQEKLDQSDPVSYIAGSMSKLRADETVVMQMVVSPHHSRWTQKIYDKIHNDGYALIDGKVRYFIVSRWWVWAAALLFDLIFNDIRAAASLALVLVAVSFFIPKREPALTPAQQEMYASIHAKLGQPLFKTDIRVLVSADSAKRVNELSAGVADSFAPLNASGLQHLYVPRLYLRQFGHKIGLFKLKNRLPSLPVFNSNIFAASELAAIYHFPYGTIKTEGMVRSHSRTLPATLGMKNNRFDVVLGQNKHHGEVTSIGLTATERERHVFIIGGTGNGKTTMLQYAIVQDIQNGKGVAVVDPHGDMAEMLLHHIPEERINDVIYFNPDDLAHPIGMNLLELTPGLEGDELLREKDLVTEAVVSVFRKIFSEDDSGGHRIEYVLRNVVQTALYVKDATLFTVYDLLNDPAYRKQVLKTIDDKNLINFWKQELGKAGDMQKVKMAAGITAKIGRFLFSASAKRILEQPRSTIDFDEVLDGKILICNFSKGLLGEDTSELFGIAILAKLQLASLRRARLKQAERKPFYLYVDEFQNFATMSFVQMLSEARKYKLFLTMAEQSTSQQEDQRMVNTILANVGTVICFRTGNPADEKLLLPLFKPYIQDGEIANLPTYNFYARLSAVLSQEPVSGETIVLKDKSSDTVAEKIVIASRVNYVKKYEPPKPEEEKSAKLQSQKKTIKRSDGFTGKPE